MIEAWRYHPMAGINRQVTKMPSSRNLTRVFRVTASLLFEKGEELSSIQSLLEGFVEKRVVRQWREKWLLTNGEFGDKIINGERLPAPPIDWKAVTIERLRTVNNAGNASAIRLGSVHEEGRSQS
jgi:hypothetical protein